MMALISKRIVNPWLQGFHSKTKVVSNRVIKPCFSTPETLRCYKLSSFDQANPSIYLPMAFFYPTVCNKFGSRFQVSQHLQNSVSKTLAYYYPFAGRLAGDDYISCNDAGIEFREIHIKCRMSEILQHTHSFAEDIVFPSGLPWNSTDIAGENFVVIQLNYFDCGGLAVAVCISHKIGDAASVATFVKDLATICRQSNYIPSPQYVASTIYPPMKDPISFASNTLPSGVSRRYVFNSKVIEKLKTWALQSGVKKPTRVQVVTASLFRSAIAASIRPSVLLQPMNLRPLIPLPHNSIGNIVALNTIVADDSNISFPEMVIQLQHAKLTLRRLYEEKPNPYLHLLDMLRDQIALFSQGKHEFYICSSSCGFPFYEIDFGWGKPVRVCFSQYLRQGMLFLIDTPCGNGIEAMVNLKEPRPHKIEEFLSPLH